MVRTLAVGFGMLTALAVAGTLTPTGQGVLGQRHSPEHVATVASILDTPAPIPGPAQPLVAAPVVAPAAPAAPKVAPAAVPARVVPPAPQRHPAAAVPPRPRASRPPQAGQPAQPQGGPSGVVGIVNILLNLPQVLDQTRVGPSGGSDSWSESRPASADPGQGRPNRKHRWVGPDAPQHKGPGDDNN